MDTSMTLIREALASMASDNPNYERLLEIEEELFRVESRPDSTDLVVGGSNPKTWAEARALSRPAQVENDND